jgi:hypothetical protein
MSSELQEPYPWTSDIEFPEQIKFQIDQLLTLAASCHAAGMEMRQVFIGVTPQDENLFIDCSDVPHPIVPSWVMMQADKHKCVALVMCSEGWTVPPEVSERWAKEGRPPGNISDQPECYEILLLQVETLKGHWYAQVKINVDGDIRTLDKELHLTKADKIGGRLTNLLKVHWEKDMFGTLEKAMEAKAHMEQERAAKH